MISKGRRQNSSVACGDFLQRMTNVGWQGFASQLGKTSKFITAGCSQNAAASKINV